MRRRLVAPIDDCDLDDPLRDQNWLALASRDTAALPPRPRAGRFGPARLQGPAHLDRSVPDLNKEQTLVLNCC